MGDINALGKARDALFAGDAEAVAAQRKAGRGTARERITGLLDPASFVELDAFAEDAAVVTGFGLIEERPVYVWAQDAMVLGGSMGAAQARKVLKVLELAGKTGVPVIALCDSRGARLEEGVAALSAYAQVAEAMSGLSGVIPQIAVVMGPCIGAAALLATLCDIVVGCEKTACVMVAPPAVAPAEALPGGIVALSAGSEEQALASVRVLVGLLPGNSSDDAPFEMGGDDWNRPVPALDQGKPEDAMALIGALADDGTAVRLYGAWSGSLRTTLARMGGRTVGFIANQAAHEDGALCPAACDQAAGFVRLCDGFNIPVISLVDTVGLAHGDACPAATLKSAARLLSAMAAATVPKISVLVGNALGMGYVIMGSKALGADLSYAWPGAVISPMDPVAMGQILSGEEIGGTDPTGDRAKLGEEYAAHQGDPMNAARVGLIDDVIEPSQTRVMLIAGLEMLAGKRQIAPPRKQNLLPL